MARTPWDSLLGSVDPSARQGRLLQVIVVVSVLLRLASACWQGNTVTDLPGIYDQLSYHALAQRVAQGHGFTFAEGHWPATRAGEPTAHWSFLYTLYLAGIYAVFGAQPLVARILQAAVVGVLHPWLVWRIGRRVFGAPIGTIAAALSAFYVYFIYYAGGLLTESFYFVGILWTMDAATRRLSAPPGSHEWRRWLELGLAIGVTGLLRQVFLLFAPFLIVWIGLNVAAGQDATNGRLRPTLRWPAVKGLALVLAVVVVLILPWSVRNHRAFGVFVPLNTNAGFAFYWGNHPIHGTTFIPILPETGPSYADLIPPEWLSLNEGALDRALLTRAIAIIADDPNRFLLLSVSRAREYVKFWPSRESSRISNVARVASFGVVLPFMLYGLWASTTQALRTQSAIQRASIILLWLFIVTYGGVHLLSWTLIRYRLPLDAVLLIFAALGLCRIMPRRCGAGRSTGSMATMVV